MGAASAGAAAAAAPAAAAVPGVGVKRPLVPEGQQQRTSTGGGSTAAAKPKVEDATAGAAGGDVQPRKRRVSLKPPVPTNPNTNTSAAHQQQQSKAPPTAAASTADGGATPQSNARVSEGGLAAKAAFTVGSGGGAEARARPRIVKPAAAAAAGAGAQPKALVAPATRAASTDGAEKMLSPKNVVHPPAANAPHPHVGAHATGVHGPQRAGGAGARNAAPPPHKHAAAPAAAAAVEQQQGSRAMRATRLRAVRSGGSPGGPGKATGAAADKQNEGNTTTTHDPTLAPYANGAAASPTPRLTPVRAVASADRRAEVGSPASAKRGRSPLLNTSPARISSPAALLSSARKSHRYAQAPPSPGGGCECDSTSQFAEGGGENSVSPTCTPTKKAPQAQLCSSPIQPQAHNGGGVSTPPSVSRHHALTTSPCSALSKLTPGRAGTGELVCTYRWPAYKP